LPDTEPGKENEKKRISQEIYNINLRQVCVEPMKFALHLPDTEPGRNKTHKKPLKT
jgi:hypothetical protein